MTEQRLWGVAVAAFVLFACLGAYAAGRVPTTLDANAARFFFGQATPVAAFFTLLGRWYVLAALAAAAAAVTIVVRGDLRVVVLLVVSQVASQGVVAWVKDVFARARPNRWLVVHERDYSYPSGHAVTTVVFYLALLLLVVRSGAVPRAWVAPAAIVLAICVAGIPWSRLALGAHFLTDIVGGLIFGCGWLCATLAIVQRVTTSSRINP